MKKVIMLFAAVLLVSGMAVASPSLLGTSGSILTPDDTVLPAAGFSANYSGISQNDSTPQFIGASIGLNDTLEIGLTRLDPDAASSDPSTILNFKYLAMPETDSRPSLVFGAVDITGAIDPDGNGGFYAVVGKNLTSFATDLTERPSQPLHAYLGYGSGIYDGVFAGLSWTLNPKIKLMGEYIKTLVIKDTVGANDMFNIGASFTINEVLSGNLALIDGEDLAFGISYNKAIQ